MSVLALIIVAFAFAVYFLIERNLNQMTNERLSDMTKHITLELRQRTAEFLDESGEREENSDKQEESHEGRQPKTIEEVVKSEIDSLNFSHFQFIVFDQNQTQLASNLSDKNLRDTLNTLPEKDSHFEIADDNEVFRISQKMIELDGKKFRLFVLHSINEKLSFLGSLRRIFYFAVPIALLLAGLGGYFLAKRSFVPVTSMSKQAENIGSTNLNKRLPVKNENDELGSLAQTFNSLLSRLENSFNQQQRFMADASHELRTPLAIIRTESEVSISNEERDANEYKESLAIVHDESKRLTNIVEDLFLLARADRGQFEPNMQSVLLDEIITDSVRAIRTLAEKRNIKVHFSELPEMPIKADSALLHRLFLNLLDNAIKYNRDNGKILINAKSNNGKYEISISDTGVGIPADKQTKIFDRFFRVDEARGRDQGKVSDGAGLGLSISAWITKTHRGKLELGNSDSNGSTFKLELPAL